MSEAVASKIDPSAGTFAVAFVLTKVSPCLPEASTTVSPCLHDPLPLSPSVFPTLCHCLPLSPRTLRHCIPLSLRPYATVSVAMPLPVQPSLDPDAEVPSYKGTSPMRN